jgi:hypothetical protein
MDYTTVLSHASKLKKNSLYKVTIAESTREILLHLNTMIVNSHDAGLSKVDFKLPINFKRIDDAVSNQELQTAIYYNIVTELEKKDYSIRLKFCESYTLMTVSWAVKTDINELKQMRNKILMLSGQ